MTNGRKATWGDAVQIEYTGRRKDGGIADASPVGEPLHFVIGTDLVFDGLQRAAWGLRVGEQRTVRIEAVDAYGERDRSLVSRVPMARDGRFHVGDSVKCEGRAAVVTAVAGGVVTVDANHPLAGEALTYEVRLLAIDEPV